MYMESIEDYYLKNQDANFKLTQNVIEELDKANVTDHQVLDNCMAYLKSMQKMMFNLNNVIESFANMTDSGEPDETYIDWLKSTVSYLQQAEKNFLYMISDTCEKYEDFIEKIIPITEKREPDMVTLDIGIKLPNPLKCRATQVNMTAKLLDIAFEKQINKPEELWDDVYIFYEFHTTKNPIDYMIRDADNFDAKHLTDLIAFYYLRKGDSAGHVRFGHSAFLDDKDFTRAVVVKADYIDAYASMKKGFFSRNNPLKGGKD